MGSNDRNAVWIPGAASTSDPWWQLGLSLGVGRVVLGLVFWRGPQRSVRVVGHPTGQAAAVDWLARMTAARDIALGAGTTLVLLRDEAAPVERATWFMAGALADTGDAVALWRGARERRLRRLPAQLMAAGAAGSALTGLAAAIQTMSPRPSDRH